MALLHFCTDRIRERLTPTSACSIPIAKTTIGESGSLKRDEALGMVRKVIVRRHHSMAADREFITLAKTSTLEEIARRTGRKPKGILRMARRLGVAIKGKPKP
jgi:hypothetical protein